MGIWLTRTFLQETSTENPMTVTTEILEILFSKFSEFVKTVDKKSFATFRTSKLVDDTENYKYSVYDEARENLGNKWWKTEDIGTGKIQQAVSSAIKTRVNHNYRIVDNNLVDWRKKDDFTKITKNKNLETILFNFYKSKIPDQQAFDNFIKENLSYQFIAYLFFIKDNSRFMPISQERFDKIFEQIGLVDFKTSGKISWDNYSTFNDIIKQVRNFLRTKDSSSTLLDAHSFLWILGNQMKSPTFISPNISQPTIEQPKDETTTQPKQLSSIQNSFLFAWNPDKWNWVDLEKNIEELQNKGTTTLRWSCRSHKSIRIGDRAFLVRLGDIPRGIMASGFVASKPFLSPHWEDEEKDVPRVLIEFDVILNPNKEPILTLDLLKTGNLSKQHWTPQSSGISIQQDCAEELEAIWFDFLTKQNVRANHFSSSTDRDQSYTEGATMQITQTRYERNPYARKVCLEHYGYSCSVCGFNFENRYGMLGSNFIHVHHLSMISSAKKSYEVNPKNDMRPVCPNCHAMLHKENPPLTIENLKSILR